jgi:hypothetical protein
MQHDTMGTYEANTRLPALLDRVQSSQGEAASRSTFDAALHHAARAACVSVLPL